MKVIGFIGSSRKTGNTAWTVNKILASAKEQGAETEVFYSGELTLSPCSGCLTCVKSNKCIINDDMQSLYDALKQADTLVLGSPIYMGQMSAQTKLFTDRLFAQITPRFSPNFKEENAGKKLILVFTQGNPDPDKFQPYYDYTKKIFGLLEFDVKEMVIVTGTRSQSASEQKELYSILENIGSALI